MKNASEILEKMNKNQKINYDRVFQKVQEDWIEQGIRPQILLHSCCAPCSTYSLEYLTRTADVTIYFANSNIHPASEYERRKIVQQQFIEEFNQRTGNEVKFISADYEPNLFIKMIQENHLAGEPEGGKRCTACFQMRLDIVAEKAKELGFDYFGSALTLSPKKNSQLINEIGLDIQKIYSVNYLPSDFKKNNGYKRSIELCKEYDVYRQCYCGCIYAAKAQGVDLKIQNREAIAFINNQKKI
ncbi:epoxyqueuosine reductase QueH [Lactococcus allomyrinae]|uniref:Epoxyqueuosine reductase QueH n=1 Tax=Lactococcus allomyrinae TaxID=2419773 RepID=A0A387BH55_9LACT|nr:epoxyqueuosine reductase QueH [Lactococcus allomyrinae]AYG00200.1 DNA integration/recombination/inversion protein [Lactococcus allomyrinae]